MSRRPAHTAEGGFTLVEVMISIMLVAIAIAGIMGLYVVSTRASQYSRHATEAAAFAELGMEKARAAAAPAAGNATEYGTTLKSDGTTISNYYTRVAVTAVDEIVNSITYYATTITVTWTENGNTNDVHSITMRARRY